MRIALNFVPKTAIFFEILLEISQSFLELLILLFFFYTTLFENEMIKIPGEMINPEIFQGNHLEGSVVA